MPRRSRPAAASLQRKLTIHLGGGQRVVPVGVPAVWLQIAALSARALQHVHYLTAVDVPQSRVQILHCREKEEKRWLRSEF